MAAEAEPPLWPEQLRALEEARKRRRLLVSLPFGSGKTRVGAEFLRAEGAGTAGARALVVAPLGPLVDTWREHLRRAGLRVHWARSAAPAPPAAGKGADVVLCTYAVLRGAYTRGWVRDSPRPEVGRDGRQRWVREHRRARGHWILDGPYAALVADEVHEVKHACASCAKALRQAAGGVDAVMGLSASPVNRDTEELVGILEALHVPEPARDPLRHVHRCAPQALTSAASGLAGAVETRLALWGLEELDAAAAAAYNTQLGRADRALLAPGGLAHLHRCLQRLEFAAAHPALLECSLARAPLTEQVLRAVSATGSPHLRAAQRELALLRAEGHRLVVLCSPYTSVLRAAAAFLSEPCAFFYSGSMTAEERAVSLRGFLAAPSAVLFLSQKAGGQGLCLVPSTALLFLNLWFTHASHDQAVARLARTGQPGPVRVSYVGARAGLLPAILALQEKDRRSAAALLQGHEPEQRHEGCRLLDTCARAPACQGQGRRLPLAAPNQAHCGDQIESARPSAREHEALAQLHARAEKCARTSEPEEEEA